MAWGSSSTGGRCTVRWLGDSVLILQRCRLSLVLPSSCWVGRAGRVSPFLPSFLPSHPSPSVHGPTATTSGLVHPEGGHVPVNRLPNDGLKGNDIYKVGTAGKKGMHDTSPPSSFASHGARRRGEGHRAPEPHNQQPTKTQTPANRTSRASPTRWPSPRAKGSTGTSSSPSRTTTPCGTASPTP